MEILPQVETVILLLVAVLALSTFARGLLMPYPIVLVLGGLALSLAPGLTVVRLAPSLVFVVFLPPILWAAAYFTSLRDFRANLRPILLLAVGLVLATTSVVAAVARWLFPAMGWPEAVALGAIVSPPDAVAATAIARRLGLPHRLIVVLEGESLVNDAVALVLYRAAVMAAVGSGSFVIGELVAQFLLAGLGGIGIGVIVGMGVRWALRLTKDGVTETLITLVAPYAAWVIAERVHASAVLACVAGGLYLRQYFSEAVAPATRMNARAFWDVLVFFLNGLIFIVIGLQLAELLDLLHGQVWPLVWRAALVSATVIVVRLAWVPVATALPRRLSRSLRERDPMPPWSVVFVLGWAGMRGIVSLAAALALPHTTATGAPFPYRHEIILMTFAVILSTLVVQGLTLTPLIRWLRLPEDDTLEREELLARERAAQAALERLEELVSSPWVLPAQVEQLRTQYRQRRQRFSSLDGRGGEASAKATAAFRRLRHAALTAERRALIRLRDEGVISDEVLHRMEQELDVEAMRLGAGEIRDGDGGP
jgi:CPA1 family monovalent cation:H+ antiporter